MVRKFYIGWVRDDKGNVVNRPIKRIANAVTTLSGGAFVGESGMGNTTPYVVIEFE